MIALFIGFFCFFVKMLHYPIKILFAFGETFSEKDGAFLNWLLKNGFPELAALSSSIRGSVEAQNWLVKNKYPHLAALDGAIDKQAPAYAWLQKYGYDFLLIFANAVNEKKEALRWLKKNDLEIFLLLSAKIRHFRDNQTYDYHKFHF